ncbi:MAG: type I-C CRISPR-associated protein Cas5c [Akkermansia muciniphila]
MIDTGIFLHVWGDWACFTRPELKAERYSYEVMTPSAAIGILSAIYWKPEIKWHIDKIHVLKPIKLVPIRRNEVAAKATAPKSDLIKNGGEALLGLLIEETRQQRASMVLQDVEYLIEAHFSVLKEQENINDNAKHYEMFKRRAMKGQSFHQPYFGTREFPVSFEWWDKKTSPPSSLPSEQQNRNLGMMLHEIRIRSRQKRKNHQFA